MPARYLFTRVVVLASLLSADAMAQPYPDNKTVVPPTPLLPTAPVSPSGTYRPQPPLLFPGQQTPQAAPTSGPGAPAFPTRIAPTTPSTPDASRPAPARPIAVTSAWTLRIGAGLGPFPGGARRHALAEEGFSPVYLGFGAGATYWLGDPNARRRIGVGASFSYRLGRSEPKDPGPTLHDSAWMALAEAPVMLATTGQLAFLLIPRMGYGSSSLSVGHEVPSHGAFTYGLDLSLVMGKSRAFALTFGYLRGIVPAHGVGGDYDLGGISFWLTGLLHV